MRVVFLEDVPGVAQGGDVKEVKNGFARNYLIPRNLAAPATHNVLQRVEGLRKQAEAVRLKQFEDIKRLAEEIDGLQVNVEMRAGQGGRLYGSVTSAIVAEELSTVTGREIDRRAVRIAEPIRQLGIFDVEVQLHAEVEAGIRVLVHAVGTDPSEVEAMEEAAADSETADDAEPAAELEGDPEDADENASEASEGEPGEEG